MFENYCWSSVKMSNITS